MVMRRSITALLLAAFLSASSASAGSAPIAALVPGKSLRGVSIGMQPSDVRRVLGKPRSDRTQSWNGTQRRQMSFSKVHVVFRGTGSTATVVNVSTTSRKERTRGVGVGSSEKQLTAALVGERCKTENGYRHCYLGRWVERSIVTDFSLSTARPRRVTSVTLGLVGG